MRLNCYIWGLCLKMLYDTLYICMWNQRWKYVCMQWMMNAKAPGGNPEHLGYSQKQPQLNVTAQRMDFMTLVVNLIKSSRWEKRKIANEWKERMPAQRALLPLSFPQLNSQPCLDRSRRCIETHKESPDNARATGGKHHKQESGGVAQTGDVQEHRH